MANPGTGKAVRRYLRYMVTSPTHEEQMAHRPGYRMSCSPQLSMESDSAEVDKAGSFDAALMVRIQSGDDRAFSQLVEKYRDAIVNYATKMTGSSQRGQDVAQETFARLFLSCGRYQERGKLRHWLYRTASNVIRSEERKSRRWGIVAKVLPFMTSDNRDNPLGTMVSQEIEVQVRKALALVPWAFRTPLVLREIEELSIGEIAELLGTKEGTVKSRINRGKAELRQHLATLQSLNGNFMKDRGAP